MRIDSCLLRISSMHALRNNQRNREHVAISRFDRETLKKKECMALHLVCELTVSIFMPSLLQENASKHTVRVLKPPEQVLPPFLTVLQKIL